MASYRTSRVIQTIILALLIFLIVLAIVFGIRAIVSNKATVTPAVGESALLNTNAERSVRMTVRGPIVADNDFMSYSIEASPNTRTMMVYRGYLKVVSSQVNANNNIPAYEQFVYALDKAGFMDGDDTTNNDTRGVCATGRLYEFETLQSGKTVKKFWTSSCAHGNTKSSFRTISSLFDKQITGSDSIISHIW